MTAKILRIEQIKAGVLKDSSVQDGVPSEPTGWDPYEVWRTRVLLPRQQDGGAESVSETPSAQDEDAGPPHKPL